MHIYLLEVNPESTALLEQDDIWKEVPNVEEEPSLELSCRKDWDDSIPELIFIKRRLPKLLVAWLSPFSSYFQNKKLAVGQNSTTR